MKKQREIIIEIEREIVVEGASDRNGWCRLCHRLVERLPTHYAAQTLQVKDSAVERLLASKALHGTEPDPSEAPICSNSLAELLRRAKQELPPTRLIEPGLCAGCA